MHKLKSDIIQTLQSVTMSTDKPGMDEMFVTCILDIVDPKRELLPLAVIEIVREKFTSSNKQFTVAEFNDRSCYNEKCEKWIDSPICANCICLIAIEIEQCDDYKPQTIYRKERDTMPVKKKAVAKKETKKATAKKTSKKAAK